MAQKHHRRRWLASSAIMLAFLATVAGGPMSGAARAQENALIQRGIPAEATAENAVQARERAHASARRIAWQRLAAATGAGGNPSDSQLESMVSALIVEEERITGTRYVGRLTVQFASGTAGLSRSGGSGGGGGGGGGAGGGGVNVPAPVQASVEAGAQFASMREWLELRRRLVGTEGVANVEVLAISTDRARLRLGLRGQPAEAQAALSGAGVWVDNSGAAWRIGLAEGR